MIKNTIKRWKSNKTGYNNRPKLNWSTEQNISLTRYIKYYNNMETKKKINWTAIWLIIKNILIALLTANALEQRL